MTPPEPSRTERVARWTADRHVLVRLVLAALAGALAVGALPPFYLLPLVVPAFVALAWLLDGARSKWGAFAIGWAFGLGYFVAGLYWVTHALLTDPEQFGWMVPFAVPSLSAGLAIFIGLATLGTHLTRTRGVARVLALAIAWSVAEWLRSFALTGFPWNPIGSIWAFSTASMQSVAYIGTFGLGFLTVIAAAMPAIYGWTGGGASRARPVAAAVLVLALTVSVSTIRLTGPEPGFVPGVTIRIVQAGVAQSHKWKPELRRAHLERHLELTRGPGIEKITHVIWPETAVPYFLTIDDVRRLEVARIVPEGGLLITGAVRQSARRPYRFWNSLHVIDSNAQIVGSYDKHHLVPFGEYVPLRRYLPLKKVAGGDNEFTSGPGPVTMALPGLPPVSPLICYEAIFPAEVVAPGPRPGWLLNITNDAWFGTSAGPHQHFVAARLRAVEQGMPLVRAANTGISAVVDAYGRVISRLGLSRSGVLDAPLPKSIRTRTIYGTIGHWGLFGLIVLAAVLALGSSRHQFRKTRPKV